MTQMWVCVCMCETDPFKIEIKSWYYLLSISYNINILLISQLY